MTDHDAQPAAAQAGPVGEIHEQMIEVHVEWRTNDAGLERESETERPICRYCWHEGPDGQPRHQDWPCEVVRLRNDLQQTRASAERRSQAITELLTALRDINRAVTIGTTVVLWRSGEWLGSKCQQPKRRLYDALVNAQAALSETAGSARCAQCWRSVPAPGDVCEPCRVSMPAMGDLAPDEPPDRQADGSSQP